MSLYSPIGIAAPAEAPPSLLDVLVEKQVLTEAEAVQLRHNTLQANSVNNAVVTLDSAGLRVESIDGRNSIQIGGRLHADAAVHEHEALDAQQEGVDGTQLRRARLYVKGHIDKQWSYLIETDFAGDKTRLKDATLGYQLSDLPLVITAGNQKQSVSMEIDESSNDMPFIERSLVAAITLPYFDRAIGVTTASGGKNWHLRTGLFGDGIADGGADEGTGFVLRGSYAPLLNNHNMLHLGGGIGLRNISDDQLVNGKPPGFSYKTTNFSDLKPISASISDMEQLQSGVASLAAMHGAWSLQSEYAVTEISRQTGSDLSFAAYYAQLAYIINGQRRYKASEGEFKYPEIHNPFAPAQGHWGAVELAARFDQLDLEDGDISGGEASRLTLAANWYLTRNVRMMLDYSRSYNLQGGALRNANGDPADNIDSYTLRLQLVF